MNPFCCGNPIPVSPAAGAAPSAMIPTPPPATPSSAPVSNEQQNRRHGAGRWPTVPAEGSASYHGRRLRHSSSALSSSALFRVASLREPITLTSAGGGDAVKINDIVGNGISGILHKWVNYGKGWRPRWFVLQDGVLSYFKIRGPAPAIGKDSKVVGEEYQRWISQQDHQSKSNGSAHHLTSAKPVGEVHLKVSTIRESRSEDKRFSIFTGTKRLYLRAESTEDRTAWMEALQAVKEMFPRISNSELMSPLDSMSVLTEKLRHRLQEEGVSDAAIEESEQIMMSEFSSLQNQLVILKQKQAMLLDTLRKLETEKVDLEDTVVDESQRPNQSKVNEESASESDEDKEWQDAAEEETEEEDYAYFDTQDFLSSSSIRSKTSDFPISETDSDDENTLNAGNVDGTDSSLMPAAISYPYVRRRKKLPDPVEKEKAVSLWSIIKDNIGKDLTKVCLPVYFNEPLSSLQKCFEDLEYSYLVDRASEWGKKGNSLMRMLHVAAFAVSAYASTDGRSCKPFNPLLGETYEADYPDRGLRFVSEKVSHHPMVVACYCEGNGWKFWGDSNLKSKFWGRSIQLDPAGVLNLEFDDGEVFQWSKVTTSIYNLILGKLYCDHYGTMHIEGNREYSCKLKFKEQSLMDRNPHQVQGVVQDRKGKKVATLIGKWDDSMHCVLGDLFGKCKGSEMSEAQLLWKRSKPPKYPTRYEFTRFAITLNELTPGLKEKLPPTDSRLRPDQRCAENGEYEMANEEKLRLEQRQRQARKMQENGWKPRWFSKDKESVTYRYIGGYWEARENGTWDGCPQIFGQVPNDQIID